MDLVCNRQERSQGVSLRFDTLEGKSGSVLKIAIVGKEREMIFTRGGLFPEPEFINLKD